MYYGFYLLAIALVIMIGQLAFALYQVASYCICHEQGPPEFHLAPQSARRQVTARITVTVHSIETLWLRERHWQVKCTVAVL